MLSVISETFEVVAENQELLIYITCEKRIKVSEIEKKKQTIKDKHTYKNLKGKNKNKKTQRITKDEGCSMIFAVQYKMEKLISKTEKDLLPSSLLNFWEILKLWRLPNQTWKCVANAASEN